MKDQILIKSEKCNTKKLLAIFIIIGIIAAIGWCFIAVYSMVPYSGIDESIERLFTSDIFALFVALIIGLVPIVIGVILYYWLGSYKLTVTPHRIYGTVAFGKRVDLPVDSVSATATSAFHGISVATSSGRISFLFIKNASEIHETINDLLIKRQEEKKAPKIIERKIPESQISNADELKKYKELLDSGIITQEEFNAKKKQLLGL